jgi:hypothetical protein
VLGLPLMSGTRHPTSLRDASRAVVAVGKDGGRGFVVEDCDELRYVVTAAHCLPNLPTPHPWADDTRTWRVLAPLGAKPTVIAACVFVDPVADIAVLGVPDAQELCDQYEDFTVESATLPLGTLLPKKLQAELEGWLLALDGAPFRCKLNYFGDGGLWVNAAQPIVGGMSGSPILADNGVVIGVVSTSSGANEGGPMPRPDANLPAWLLHKMASPRRVPSRLTAEAKKHLRWVKAHPFL